MSLFDQYGYYDRIGVKALSGNGDIYAQSTNKPMKYVDDLELWLDPANKVVQVRSASRLGRKDLGVNREAPRAGLTAAG